MKRAILVLMLAAATAFAGGGTGGRMGGGSWGGSKSTGTSGGFSSPSHSWSSSSSSSSGSHWSSSSGWSSSSSSSSYHSSTPSFPSSSTGYSSGGGGTGVPYDPTYDPSPSFQSHDYFGTMVIIFIAVVFIIILFATLKDFFGSSGGPMPDYLDMPSGGDTDITVLRIVVDGRSRKYVQSELARIAKIADTSTDEGRVAMLREVSLMLRRIRDAWVYGGAVNEPMRDIGAAKPVFDRYVDDARARFQHETVVNEQGKKSTAASPGFTPRSDEGAGLILVTIVIAARRELYQVTRIGDGDELRHALESAASLTPDMLVAVEVVWMPSEDEDRLSSMELEAKYPRPEIIPITGALVGKTFCTYCGGPFPGELVTCPHCGAPAPGRVREDRKQAA